MQVGLGPGNFVLDRDPAPPSQKRGTAPIFSPCLLWSNSWMDQDATWYGGRPQPRWHCWMRTQLPLKGAQPPPNFQPMSVVAKRPLDGLRCHLVWM